MTHVARHLRELKGKASSSSAPPLVEKLEELQRAVPPEEWDKLPRSGVSSTEEIIEIDEDGKVHYPIVAPAPVPCNTEAGHWFEAGGDRCSHCGKTSAEVGLTIAVSHERTPEWETLLKELSNGPRPEFRESGPERGQDYYTPGESYNDFNGRIVGLLKEALASSSATRRGE
jgi:hypothetical protein